MRAWAHAPMDEQCALLGRVRAADAGPRRARWACLGAARALLQRHHETLASMPCASPGAMPCAAVACVPCRGIRD